MLNITEQFRNQVIQLIAMASHPRVTFAEVNDIINALQKLESTEVNSVP